MDAKNISDMIVFHVKKSSLNYSIQESPFSLLINIRKSFIRDKHGENLLPSSAFSEANSVSVKSEKNEEENLSLQNTVKELEVALDGSKKDLYIFSMKLEKAKIELEEALVDKNEVIKENQKIELKLKDKVIEIKTIK